MKSTNLSQSDVKTTSRAVTESVTENSNNSNWAHPKPAYIVDHAQLRTFAGWALEMQKPKTITAKKSSSISSSNDLKKLPTKGTATSKTTTTSKSEEKKKTLVPRAISTLQPTPVKRVPNGSTTKPSAIKPPLVRSNSKAAPSTTPTLNSRLAPEKRTQPLKAKRSPSTFNAIPVRPPSSKPNLVMTTVHNVTVSSPPSKRREIPIEPIIEMKEPRLRSKSRTLSPEEIVILKGMQVDSKKEINEPLTEIPVKIKEPVAFEVVFDEKQKQAIKHKSPSPSDSDLDYDDDFESYESDFETGSSSAEVGSVSSTSSEVSPKHDRDRLLEASENDTEPEGHSEDDEESEVTQFPITVIHRDKEQERKLDSGNYDLHLKKRQPIESFDSLDTLANYEQLDSGISYENSIPTASIEPGSFVLSGYSGFYTRPKITKRGIEIMSKIQFDMITFTLLELKPIAYDTYMRMFGGSNTVQSATQTLEDRMDSECQTDEDELRSVWTQHPAQYDLVTIQGSSGAPICTGELPNGGQINDISNEDPFDSTIRALSKLRQGTPTPGNTNRHKPINFERLNAFLNNSSHLIERILSSNSSNIHLETIELPAPSNGFYKLNSRLLNALKVVRVFASDKFNLILTVHESIANVYENDFSNLIMVWNSGDPSKPVRLLSTWSEVCRAEICNESSDIIVCGLRDGSIAMWDLRETYSFCSKLDGYLTHFAATHSIAPSWGGADMCSFDLGAVVDVKSFRSSAKTITSADIFKTIQFASLNETGIITIWTLVETGVKSYETTQGSDSKLEYSSPWSRVKLIQSAICDLRKYIELGCVRPKSAFERTKSNFQKEIFEDDILKEIAQINSNMKLGLQGLRFINLDCGTELIFVGTNRSFIISCSKTLKRERFRKINIVDSGFLFPTAIKLLQNENYLVVGLSNGSVIILNCNQRQTNEQHQPTTNSEHLRRQGTAKPHDRNEFDFEIGKSCAIQNIIRNERLSSNSHFVEHEFRPNTATFVAKTIESGKKPFEMRNFDEQMLLNGSVLRKDLIQNLEISSDGWTLFALSDGDVKAYDFFTEKEVPFNVNKTTSRKITEIAVCHGGGEANKLILLDQNNDVQVHLLK